MPPLIDAVTLIVTDLQLSAGHHRTPPRSAPASLPLPEAAGPAQLAPSGDADNHIHAPDSDVSPGEEASPSAAEWATIVFDVHMLDYDTETVAVQLPIPCGLSYALQRLSSARNEAGRRLFPRLFPASHQPAAANCLVLAAPAWASSGVFVLVENGFAGSTSAECPAALQGGGGPRAAAQSAAESTEVSSGGPRQWACR